jgi:hypothetical protein
MKLNKYGYLIALVLVVLALASGCTSPQTPATSPQTVVTPGSAPGGIQTTVPAASSASAAPVKTANIDTTINVHFNDYTCFNVQNALGKEYLYPDEKYRLSASPARDSNVNVNVVFVDDNDTTRIQGVRPKWDIVQKKWTYEGIVPLAQFDDITSPVEKTIMIKTQSKYSICVDDRKESGVSDIMIQVPVKLLRV